MCLVDLVDLADLAVGGVEGADDMVLRLGRVHNIEADDCCEVEDVGVVGAAAKGRGVFSLTIVSAFEKCDGWRGARWRDVMSFPGSM